MSGLHRELYEADAELVTGQELQLLKEHEPGVTFTIVSAEEAGLRQGRQSRVSVLEYQRSGEGFQVLWKRMAAGKGLDEAEAVAMNARLTPYRQALVEAGGRYPNCSMPASAPYPVSTRSSATSSTSSAAMAKSCWPTRTSPTSASGS